MEKGLAGLQWRRKRAGFTQQTFADALGIERARYANYEIGISWPSARLLPDMAALLGCCIDELYEKPEETVERIDTPACAPVRNDRLAATPSPQGEGEDSIPEAEA